jgi:hypothetical protein
MCQRRLMVTAVQLRICPGRPPPFGQEPGNAPPSSRLVPACQPDMPSIQALMWTEAVECRAQCPRYSRACRPAAAYLHETQRLAPRSVTGQPAERRWPAQSRYRLQGDPACALIVAWNLLLADMRTDLRAALRVGDATWQARPRLGRCPWRSSNARTTRVRTPVLAASARCVTGEVLANHMRAA